MTEQYHGYHIPIGMSQYLGGMRLLKDTFKVENQIRNDALLMYCHTAKLCETDNYKSITLSCQVCVSVGCVLLLPVTFC